MTRLATTEEANTAMLENLERNGVTMAPGLSAVKIADIATHLLLSDIYNAHVKAKATERMSWQAPYPAWPMFCHDMHDVVLAPHWFEIAVGLLPLARAYFGGEQPLLYSMNAFWTQPAPGRQEYQDTHGWHRDGDDRKQLVAFAYGTDVMSTADGAHWYQRGSHLVSDDMLERDFRQPPMSVVEIVTGRAGTVFLADTLGLHMGCRPQTKRRLLLWARFGVSDPPMSYHQDELEPVNAVELGARYGDLEPATRDAVRLVVR